MCLVNDNLIDWVKCFLDKYSFELVHIEEREYQRKEGDASGTYIYLVIRSPLGMSYRFMTMSGASKQHQMSQIEEFVKDKFYEDSINAFHRKTQKEINEIG